jgi:predicted dehydrogenase
MSAVAEKKLAIVGLGAASRPYLEALEVFPELRLVAAIEPDARRRRAHAGRGTRIFESVADLLRYRAVPDLAIVCSPSATHTETSVALLRAGSDLLVESPLATTPHDADCIESAAERLGRVLVTAAPFRSSLAVVEARNAIAAGRIGRLQGIQATLASKRDAGDGWRADPSLSGGGVWMELGPAALDVAEALAGSTERIRMIVCAQRQGAGIEDEVVVETHHTDDVIARMHLNWNRETTVPIARCIGDRGEILIGWTQTVLRTSETSEAISVGHDETALCQAIIADALRRRLDSDPPIDHGAQAVAWIHAAYRSLRDRSWQHT